MQQQAQTAQKNSPQLVEFETGLAAVRARDLAAVRIAAQGDAKAATQWLKMQANANAAQSRLVQDSRAVRLGDVFFAMPGGVHDGRQFIDKAQTQGAAAVLWDSDNFLLPTTITTSNFPVAQLKQAAGYIAADWYAQPSEKLHVFAYTGTSGKTSCSTWTSHVLNALGHTCAVVGTRGAGIGDQLVPIGLTTPQAIEMQSLLAQFVQQGAKAAAIEASSIGLDEGRLNGTQVRTALFTNLSRDHLDYHGDMQSYAEAKAQLFCWSGLQTAVINSDDPLASEIQAKVPAHVEQILISVKAEDQLSTLPAISLLNCRHLFAHQLRFNANGLSFTIDGDFGVSQVQTRIAGLFNISNLLMVAACALLEGFELKKVVAALEQLEPVEGRMQMLGGGYGGFAVPVVVIDYAHKPDALEKVLQSLLPQARANGGQLWCVFGCGGDRDSGKRAIMGSIAQRLADFCIVTSDNPRSEDPASIADQIASAMQIGGFEIELDRAKAIAKAVQQAKANDVVLIAGKGHEAYQEINGERIVFSDAQHVSSALDLKAMVH